MNESEFRSRFAKKLIFLRKQKKLTQSELAESLNYSDKAVSKWERGESIPDAYNLYRIAEFFGISISDFFTDEMEIIIGSTSSDMRKRSVKVFVPLISIAGVFFLASIVFFVMKNVPAWNDYAYYSIIYSLPVACIVITVFSGVWWNMLLRCVSVSALIWSLAVALYSSVNVENFKYIFLISGVLQVGCVLAFLFYHFFTKAKK